MPAGLKPTKRSQKDIDATWTKKHGQSIHPLLVSHRRRRAAVSEVITDLFEAQTIDQQLGGTGMPQGVRPEMRGLDVERAQTAADDVVETIS